jgi:type II secretion system (T2SS) protein E
MSLSSLIVQRQVATMRQVEEALARQVIYGGDLVTNLLEVALVDESVLIDLLAASIHLPPAPAGELPRPSDAARVLVSPEVAAETVSIPLEVRGNDLVLAVAEPLSESTRRQLSLSAGMRIEERAAPAVRVWQAIAKTYGTRLDRRMHRLVGRLAGEEWASATPLAPPISSQAPAARVPAPTKGSSRRSAAVGPTGTAPIVAGLPPLPRSAQTTVAGAASMRPGPRRHSTLKTFPTERPAPTMVQPPPVMTEEAAPGAAAAERQPELIQRTSIPPARPGQRHRGPLLFEDASDEADEAEDRDALLGLAFDFARQFFEYTALFLLHGDIAEGKDGFGSGATRERVLGIGVPLDLPSLLARAREARIAIVGSAQPDGLDAVLLADLQRPRDAEMAVIPIVVRTRAVGLLIGDCGDAGIDRPSLRQVTELCGVVSKAFERIIVRRKLDGFIAGARTASSGRVQAAMVPFKGSVTGEQPAVAAPPVATLPVATPSIATPTGAEPEVEPPPESEPETPFELRRGIRHRSSAPPAVNIATVRRISGPPIPREEPESAARHSSPDGGRASLAALRNTQAGIQPIDEVTFLVDRITAGVDPQAEAEFARLPDRTFEMLMARFPGPVAVPRMKVAAMARPPPASECGPILALVVRARKRSLPYLLGLLTDSDAERRGWAAQVFCELPWLPALPALRACQGDPDLAVRAAASHAIQAMTKAFGASVVDALTRLRPDATPEERAHALHTMGQAGEPATVPDLIRGLDDDDERVVAVAHDALVRVTRQDLGATAAPWLEWWDQNAGRDRIEWLIDALVHDTAEIRHAAGEELRSQSRQYFAYSSDLPARDRERAQQRYRDWWVTEGRTRHVRP